MMLKFRLPIKWILKGTIYKHFCGGIDIAECKKIISDIHFWNNLSIEDKEKKLSNILNNFNENMDLVEYFDKFSENLSKKTLNSYLKSVSNP